MISTLPKSITCAAAPVASAADSRAASGHADVMGLLLFSITRMSETSRYRQELRAACGIYCREPQAPHLGNAPRLAYPAAQYNHEANMTAAVATRVALIVAVASGLAAGASAQ